MADATGGNLISLPSKIMRRTTLQWCIVVVSLLLTFGSGVKGLAVDPNGSKMTTLSSQRRAFLGHVAALSSWIGGVLLHPSPAPAAVTDETDAFGDNWWTTEGSKVSSNPEPPSTSASPIPQDEVVIRLSKSDLQQGLGIELGEVEFRGSVRVFVKSVQADSLAGKKGIQKNFVFVSLNDVPTERTNAQGVVIILGRLLKDTSTDYVDFRFRDPSGFRTSIASLAEGESTTTQVAPAGQVRKGVSQEDQTYTVTQLVAPKLCTVGAQTDDLLEISYVGQVVETGQIFDGSAVKINGDGIPGRGNDVTLYFVLGKQPMGQFPPGWDTGLYGMCVGERRRLLIPPVLAYGSKGLPRRGIPPDATLQYDISLVSVNGLSTPR